MVNASINACVCGDVMDIELLPRASDLRFEFYFCRLHAPITRGLVATSLAAHWAKVVAVRGGRVCSLHLYPINDSAHQFAIRDFPSAAQTPRRSICVCGPSGWPNAPCCAGGGQREETTGVCGGVWSILGL